MELRKYQQEAKAAIFGEWDKGNKKTLLVLPTGTGKTIVFAKVAEDCVKAGKRVLIMAHRAELLEQAADKIKKATGLGCAVEKAEKSCLGSWYRIVVGSVQSLTRDKRLQQFNKEYFDVIIVDEAHHAISDSYQNVLQYFDDANGLGVTATPDRGDMQNLGQYYDSLAYEYTLPRAIKDGYLSKIKAQTIPLKLDLAGVGMQGGDYKAGDLGTALDPYLYQIAQEMTKYCADRKTVVFLPLVKTSQKFRDFLNQAGFRAAEVNGNSNDRAEVLRDFDQDKYNVLCNSMLLTEGWDCPSVDCVVVLRPTKVRSLYCLDMKTEVLTENGWKTSVGDGEKVAAFNIDTKEIKFVPALATIQRTLEKDEYFCSISGPSTDIRVTNKHRMLYDNKRQKGWKFTTAEHLADMSSGSYIPVSGNASFPGVPLTDDEIRFIGWVMTDGNINKTNGAITITQGEHQPWLEEIQKCINGCRFKYNRFVRKRDSQFTSNSDSVVWTISKGKPRDTDKHLRGWSDLESYISKNISPLLNNMSVKQFSVMLEAIHLGDGHKQKSANWTQRSYHISKGNKEFIEGLQIMAILRGYRASVSPTRDIQNHLIWTAHIKNQEFVNIGSRHDGRPTWIKEKHSNEKCWCVENELGTLITRRNGKIAIVGNCQMVGRGTRLFEGKEDLLLLDFLWNTERHELCRPAHLIASNEEVAQKITETIEQSACPLDLEAVEKQASDDVVAAREEALAKKLSEMKKRKKALVDPLQFEMSIQAEDLSGYVPAFGWEMGPPSEKQVKTLEKLGIFPDEIDNAGKATKLLDRLDKRRMEGLTTPKQIRFLESRGFQHVGTWQFEHAKTLIDRIAGNGWHIPSGITPNEYKPGE